MKELYPITSIKEEVLETVREMVRIRDSDVVAFNNLKQQFVSGRGLFLTRAAPSTPTNVLATDQVGDICNDATYEYKLLSISGTLKWDRRALNVGW